MQYLQKSNLWENDFFDFFIVFHLEIILFLSRLNDAIAVEEIQLHKNHARLELYLGP